MNQYAKYAKSCMAALIFAAIASSFGCASAPAAEPTPAEESPCPNGPFETDRGKIVTAIASLPPVSTKPSRERRSSRQPDVWTLANGVISEGGGGLPSPYRVSASVGVSARVEYDATRYFARYVRTVATILRNDLGDYRYYIATVRPTVEQARDIACLVNKLLQSPAAPAKQEAKEPQAISGEIVVTAPKRKVCDIEYTDGHGESLQIWVGGTPATFSTALSCSDVVRLDALLSGSVGAAFSN
jgi:hypothetical protein